MTFNLIISGILLVVAVGLEHSNYRAYALITGVSAAVLGMLTLNGHEYVLYIVAVGYPITMGLYLFGSTLNLLTESASTFMDSH
ncbi:hypothetical protein ACFL2U_02390 [Patescibacteria group bacterium]